MLAWSLSHSDRFVAVHCMHRDILCSGRCSLTSSPPQLVDMFLNEKWSEYVSQYPELGQEMKLVAPCMVHGLLTRCGDYIIIMSRLLQPFQNQFQTSKTRVWHVNVVSSVCVCVRERETPLCSAG